MSGKTFAEKYGEGVGEILARTVDKTASNMMQSFGFGSVDQMRLAGYDIIIDHGPHVIRVKIAKVEKESVIRF